MKVLLNTASKSLYQPELFCYFILFLLVSIFVRLAVIFLKFSTIEKYILKGNCHPQLSGWSPSQTQKDLTSSDRYTPLIIKETSHSNRENTNNQTDKNLTLAEISYMIKRVTQYAPWRVMCLEQALLACLYFNFKRMSYSFYLGVDNSQTGTLSAHAWLIVNDAVITGGAFPGGYSVIYHHDW